MYSPAFEQLTEPLRWLGWDAFRTIWRLLEIGALVVMTGPLAGPLLFVQPISGEVNNADINLLMPLAIVAGFRFPALWSFVLLTKISPGVGLLWFAVRREWRSLGVALGVTSVIVAVSFATVPSLWFDWFHLLTTSDPNYADVVVVAGPIWLRVLAAAALVTWGALTDRRWTVLAAAWLALPATWLTTLAMLVGLVPLLRSPRSWSEPRSGLPR